MTFWIKQCLRRVIPKALLSLRRKRLLSRAARRYADYDIQRFIQHSGIAAQDVASLWAQVTRLEHVFEKAFSLPESRVGFGTWAVEEMLETLPEYLHKAGYDETAGRAATALRTYLSFHEKRGTVAPHHERIRSLLDSLPVRPNDCSPAGATVLVQRDELTKQVSMPFGEFAYCRHSIRQFAQEPVPDDQILRAVRIAQKSPSVCNRQGARAHIYSKQDKKTAILGIQKGNRGFGHLASHVVIITFDLRCLLDPGDRHQAWVDGGLFAMSFLYAIHSMGLGACPLQWGVAPEDDLALHAVAEIPEYEEVIMLAVVGSLPPSFVVAASVRKDIHDVGFVH